MTLISTESLIDEMGFIGSVGLSVQQEQSYEVKSVMTYDRKVGSDEPGRVQSELG